MAFISRNLRAHLLPPICAVVLEYVNPDENAVETLAVLGCTIPFAYHSHWNTRDLYDGIIRNYCGYFFVDALVPSTGLPCGSFLVVYPELKMNADEISAHYTIFKMLDCDLSVLCNCHGMSNFSLENHTGIVQAVRRKIDSVLL